MEKIITPTHITCSPDVCGGKPVIAGTRIRVRDISFWHYREGKSPEEIVAEYPQLGLASVYAALAHYWDHRDEFLRDEAETDRLIAELKQRHPPKLPTKLRKPNDPGDEVSPG